MTKTLQSNREIRLFDSFSLVIPPKLKYHTDGLPGHRVLFITDAKENFVVSFEEGMQLMDMSPEYGNTGETFHFHCRKDGKYIHQCRSKKVVDRCAFFHLELEHTELETQILPGQIVVSSNYQWTNGVEPVLMKLLDGITVSSNNPKMT